jgi:hypothetical protein
LEKRGDLISMWHIHHDRAVGSSHEEKNQPCQDNATSATSEDKKWHAVCISDGAGSSKHAEISSKIVSEAFCESLIQIAVQIDENGPGSWINDKIIYELLELRKKIKADTGAAELDDYHATLVALLMGESASIAVQIGDGAIFAGETGLNAAGQTCINSKVFFSLPENGEYKNETYFITEPHWIKHIRITVFGKIDWFAMGTDGGIETLCDREEVNGQLLAQLLSDVSQAKTNSSITDHITSKESRDKTGDDITCAMGVYLPRFTDVPAKWDNDISSPIYLDPDSRIEEQPVNNIHIPPSVIRNVAPPSKEQKELGLIYNFFHFDVAAISITILAVILIAIFLSLFLVFREDVIENSPIPEPIAEATSDDNQEDSQPYKDASDTTVSENLQILEPITETASDDNQVDSQPNEDVTDATMGQEQVAEEKEQGKPITANKAHSSQSMVLDEPNIPQERVEKTTTTVGSNDTTSDLPDNSKANKARIE